MKLMSLEVYSSDSNVAVIRLPERRYPGSVIQGDSLSILAEHARIAAERTLHLGIRDEELCGAVQELHELLLDRILHYQSVLAQHEINLPFNGLFSEADLVGLIPDDD